MRLTKTEKRTILFLTLLLVITVGYALLSQTLDINGTTNIKKSNWSIIWDNVVVNENSVKGDSVTTAAAITNTEKTLVEYSITLSEPGEFYEFTVDAKNEGTIDGMINTVSNKVYESNGTTEKTLPEYLTYTVTYSDGKAIEPKHLLSAGTTEKYKVRVEFKDVTADKLPTQEETIKFKFSVDYVQADENAIALAEEEEDENVENPLLEKPLSEATIGLVSSDGIYVRNSSTVPSPADVIEIPIDTPEEEILIEHSGYQNVDDINAIFPIVRMKELIEEGTLYQSSYISYLAHDATIENIKSDTIPTIVEWAESKNLNAIIITAYDDNCLVSANKIKVALQKAGYPVKVVTEKFDDAYHNVELQTYRLRTVLDWFEEQG